MKKNTKTFLKKAFFVGTISILSNSMTHAATASTTTQDKKSNGINIDGLVGKFPFALEKIMHRIVEIKNSLKSQSTIPKGSNRFLFYGNPGNGKRSVAQIIAHKEEIELIDISGGFLQTSSPEEGLNELERAFNEADSIVEHDQTVILMIDNIGLISKNKNLRALFWQKLDAIKNDPHFIVIGIENSTIVDTFLKEKFNALSIKFENPDSYTQKSILELYWQTNLGNPSKNELALINRISSKCLNLPAEALKDIIETAISSARQHGLSSPNEKNLLDAINSIKKKDYHLPRQRNKKWDKVGGAVKEYGIPAAMAILNIWLGKKTQEPGPFGDF